MDLRVQECGQSMKFTGRCFISDTLENSITLFCGHLLYSEIRKLLFILLVYVSIVLTGVALNLFISLEPDFS